MKPIGTVLVAAALLAGTTAQAAPGGTVYRCPGPPVLYTDAIGVQQARERGCQPLEPAPVSVMQDRPPRRVAAPAAPAVPSGSAASVPARGVERVAAPQQRERDNDARSILQAELQREQARLQQLLAEYNDGQPERQGHERNYQRYLDRVAALKAAIERSSADIAALQRELARHARP